MGYLIEVCMHQPYTIHYSYSQVVEMSLVLRRVVNVNIERVCTQLTYCSITVRLDYCNLVSEWDI